MFKLFDAILDQPFRKDAAGAFFFLCQIMTLFTVVMISIPLVAVLFVLYLVRDTWRVVFPAALALVVLSSTTAHGQDIPTPGETRLARLTDGDRAPFTGILAPEALYVDWRNRIVLLEQRLEIEGDAANSRELALESLHEGRLSFEVERRALERDLYINRIDALVLQLVEAREDAKTGFFEQPAFWFAMGVIVTGIGVALVAVVASNK